MVKPKLLDQVRYAIRVRHLSYRTEQAYVHWIRKFILFHGKSPKDMGESEVSQFLTYLTVKKRVAASTQNQALFATLFLYREVLKKELFFWNPENSNRACPLNENCKFIHSVLEVHDSILS